MKFSAAMYACGKVNTIRMFWKAETQLHGPWFSWENKGSNSSMENERKILHIAAGC